MSESEKSDDTVRTLLIKRERERVVERELYIETELWRESYI